MKKTWAAAAVAFALIYTNADAAYKITVRDVSIQTDMSLGTFSRKVGTVYVKTGYVTGVRWSMTLEDSNGVRIEKFYEHVFATPVKRWPSTTMLNAITMSAAQKQKYITDMAPRFREYYENLKKQSIKSPIIIRGQ